MPHIYRIGPSGSSPRITILDPAVPHPREWVISGVAPEFAIPARIDRPAHPKMFCHLEPGILVLPEEAIVDERPESAGPSTMYWALWYGSTHVDLEVDGKYFRCFVPTTTLEPDAATGSPCRFDRVYASVFRLEGHAPDELFSASGITGGGAYEFDRVYGEEEFDGIEFESIWSRPD